MTQFFAGRACSSRTFRIRMQLSRLGLSSSHETYRTLCLMVEAALDCGESAPQMKVLHAHAAAHSGKKLAAITRSLSRAMDELWDHCDREALAELFGHPLSARPLPRDFVFCMRDHILAQEETTPDTQSAL